MSIYVSQTVKAWRLRFLWWAKSDGIKPRWRFASANQGSTNTSPTRQRVEFRGFDPLARASGLYYFTVFSGVRDRNDSRPIGYSLK